jgi:hypothetical protein
MAPYNSLPASRLNHVAITLLEKSRFELAYETFKEAYLGKDNLEEAVKRLRSSNSLPCASRTTYTSLFLLTLVSTKQTIDKTIEKVEGKFQLAYTGRAIVNLPIIRFCGNEEGVTSEIAKVILGYNMAVAYQAYGMNMWCRKGGRDASIDHICGTALKLMKASDKALAKIQVSSSLGSYQERRCALMLRLCILLGLYELTAETADAAQVKHDLESIRSKLSLMANRDKLTSFPDQPKSPIKTIRRMLALQHTGAAA